MSSNSQSHKDSFVRRTISLPVDVVETLETRAKDEYRSFSGQVLQLIDKGLEKEQQEAASA